MTKADKDKLELEYAMHGYSAYLAQRQKLIDIETESAKTLDKFIVTLAAGGLGFSITLIEKIALNPSNIAIVILIASWGAFVLTIIATLISYQCSVKAMQRQREILDLEYERGDPGKLSAEEKLNGYVKPISYLNILAMSLFILGVALLCTFSIINLLQKERNHDTQRSESLERKTGNYTASIPTATTQTQIITSTTPIKINQDTQKETSMSKDAPKNEQPKSLGNDLIKAGRQAPTNAIPPRPPTQPKK